MVNFFDNLFVQADRFLIFFYRLTGHPYLDYFIGTICLGFMCVLLGEITVSLGIRINKRYIDQMAEEIEKKEKLSMAAYNAGDKAGYKALNKQATDEWGKHFFTMAGYSAGILWPIPFALGWMQTRFYGVDFELALPLSLVFGKTVGYTFTFIPLYILARIIFKHMRPYLPYFKGVQKALDHYGSENAPRP
jgi:hypothetical protein